MDKLDWKILQILDWDGKLPINKIAKFARSNKDVVAYRIRKLEESKIILNYFPIIDMHKLGYYTSRLYFDLEEMNNNKQNEFVEFLDKEINAGLIFWHDYPPYTCGIFLWTKSIYEVQNKVYLIKKKLGKVLSKYNYTIISTYRQYPKDYLFGKKFHDVYRSLEPTEEIEYDNNDYNILRELAQNARLSTVEIAKKIGIPQTSVSHKIRLLEKKKIIIGYRAMIDFIKIGYTNYFLEIYLDDSSNLEKIESWANLNRNVVWLQKLIGTCDIEIEVEVKDRKELEILLNDLKTHFNNIRKIIFWSQEYKKLTFLP